MLYISYKGGKNIIKRIINNTQMKLKLTQNQLDLKFTIFQLYSAQYASEIWTIRGGGCQD